MYFSLVIEVYSTNILKIHLYHTSIRAGQACSLMLYNWHREESVVTLWSLLLKREILPIMIHGVLTATGTIMVPPSKKGNFTDNDYAAIALRYSCCPAVQ